MAETPTREHAEGMLASIKANHTCTTACTDTKVLGDGKRIQLRCPWEQIDLDNPADRRIVQGVYAAEAREALHKGGAR